jgi:hypothetical protein
MDSSKTPAERLLDLLVPLMEREGYAYRKSNHRFQKPFAHGNHEYWLMFDARGGLVGVDAGFYVRFETLEKHFKKALGFAVPWTAGATLLNAGANPWKYFLNEDRFAAMTPQERSGLPSDVVHPQARIEAAAQFLMDAHRQFALPLFERLQGYRQLADFYREYMASGFIGRCRPMAHNVVYLSLLVAASLGDDPKDIVTAAKGLSSLPGGQDVDASVQKVMQYLAANDLKAEPSGRKR